MKQAALFEKSAQNFLIVPGFDTAPGWPLKQPGRFIPARERRFYPQMTQINAEKKELRMGVLEEKCPRQKLSSTRRTRHWQAPNF